MNTNLTIDIFFILFLLIGITFLVVIIVLINRISMKKIIQEKSKQMQLEISYKEKMILSNLKVQEKERKRFSGELHDNLISKLNIVTLIMQQSESHNKDVLKKIEEGVIIARKISHDLSPPLLNVTPIEEMLEELLYSIKLKYEIEFDANIESNVTINKDFKLQLYRVFQEAINNIIKHSEAKRVSVYLRITSKFLSFCLVDDGKGFDDKLKKNGLGLENMILRAQYLGGKIKYKSKLNKGVRLIFVMKIPQNN